MFHWISFFIDSLNINWFPKPESDSLFRIFHFQLYIDIWKLNFGTPSKKSLNHQLIVEPRTLGNKLNIDESYWWVMSSTMKFLKNMSLRSTQNVLFLFFLAWSNAQIGRSCEMEIAVHFQSTWHLDEASGKIWNQVFNYVESKTGLFLVVLSIGYF